jgi:hypothetical protein
MKPITATLRATAMLLLAAAMPAELNAETSASNETGVNPQTQICGVYVEVGTHICRNVDDDQSPENGQYEQWDIDHIPSDRENDLKTVTITGTAGPTGGTMTLEILAGGDKINYIFWKDGEKKEQQYQLSWSVPPNSSRTETLYIEGYTNSGAPRDVKFKGTINCPAGTVGGVNYSAASATDIAETAVYEIDIDIDSLNDNGYEPEGYTDDEDRIEASEKEEDGVKKPGKIVVSGIDTDGDSDGIPDFADLQTSGQKFVPVRVTLKEPFKPDENTEVEFAYTESKPEQSSDGYSVTGNEYTLNKGGMRLWKKDAPAARAIADHIESKDAAGNLIKHSWEDVVKNAAEVSEDKREVILYLDYVDKETPVAAGRHTIKITATEKSSESATESASEDGAKCEDEIVATLVPIKLNGLDRYVEGRIPMAAMEMIGGIERLSLQFVATDGSGEIHGSFNGLSGAHIYDMEQEIGPDDDHIASDSEIEAFPDGMDPRRYDDSAQDTVFWIENGEMVFATTFNNAVPIRIQVTKGGELLGSVEYKLTPHQECSDLIDSLDQVFEEIFKRIPPPPVEPPLLLGQPPLLLALGDVLASSSQVSRFGFLDKLIKHRNLVTKSIGAAFNKVKEHVVRGAVIVAQASVEAVKTNLVFGQGFVLGLWAGVKEDAEAVWGTVKVVASLLTNPQETCASFRRAFNEMLGITWEQFKQIPEKLIEQFIADSEAKIAWAGPGDLKLFYYIAGYSTGYITEKVGLAILTGGLSAAATGVAQGANLAAKFVKIIQVVRNASQTAAKLIDAAKVAADAVRAANAMKAKLFRYMSQFAKDKTGLTAMQNRLNLRIKSCQMSVNPAQ